MPTNRILFYNLFIDHFGGGSERGREISHPLAYSPNTTTARARPGQSQKLGIRVDGSDPRDLEASPAVSKYMLSGNWNWKQSWDSKSRYGMQVSPKEASINPFSHSLEVTSLRSRCQAVGSF